MGIAKEKVTNGILKFNAIILKSASLLFFPASEKCLYLVVTWGKSLQWLKSVELLDVFPKPALLLALSLDLSLEASSVPLGTAFSCLLVDGDVEIEFHQGLGQWLMFLLFLGMFWGFGAYIPAHCLHTHSLPPTTMPLTQPKGYIWYQNAPDSESPRSRMAWGWNTWRDKCLLRELTWGNGFFYIALNRSGAEE